MKNADVIVIGAGASGLMAAYTLSKAGKTVIVLEARDRIGGRIHTISDESFFKHAELGAEFVHGNLPVTLHLLKKAGIEYISAEGEMWHYNNGKLAKGAWDIEGWDKVMEKLSHLDHDVSIGNFLQDNFSGDKYEALRNAVSRYVSGYDTADPFSASSFALREEWENEDEGAQYRVTGGYGKLIDFLANDSKTNGAAILLNAVVKEVRWGNGRPEVLTADGKKYGAGKLVVALPLGVLNRGAIIFQPGIDAHENALKQIGFGAIVKLLFQFKERFWETGEAANLGFVLSAEEIPTWWTQYPTHSAVITGWLGGPPAECRKHLSDVDFLRSGIRSLANIFKRKPADLENELVSWKVVNWTTDSFTCGSYAYDMVNSSAARKTLEEPVDDMIYFAGEYLYEGAAMGTVEAALSSGLNAARKLE
ncbi:NAD(P)/FAD-dependent oxidoreductase [Mucilaginibacter sp.]|jgi:monoamine oxidase|uniref:flavin monoamine oxidase family protein n=1 Tax=Mucilaginibacter sp. TaxID=1882438 RepID=UPI002CB4A0D4|nr:NAD(P)/FAD-dependent oxidoreductase [Mucilaginibacter sp.]HTI61102.1 NAD(P)/FAD-dependent oxidoreductase [Mucilaginibacter sp.]